MELAASRVKLGPRPPDTTGGGDGPLTFRLVIERDLDPVEVAECICKR